MLKDFFGDKPFWKISLKLAIPIAIQNMLTSSFALIDTLMVSRLGDIALSSVGMAGQWNWLLNLVSFGLCSGMSVLAAQYWGVGDKKSMRKVFGIALIASLFVSVFFASVGLLIPEKIIYIFNKDSNVIASGSQYMQIACLGYPAVALNIIMSGFLRNIEKVKVPMYVSAITTILNAFMNYCFIFGKFGAKEMGVSGAALSTCLSAWMGPVLLLIISIIQKNEMVKNIKDIISFNLDLIKLFLKRAMPVVFNESVWALGIVILNTIYSNMGYEYYAAVTILKTMTDLSFAFFVGLGNACVIMVGKSVGSGKIERAVTDSKRFSFIIPAIALLIGSLMAIFKTPLISIFNTGENISEITLLTAQAIVVFTGLEMALRMIPYVQVVGVFRSGGDTLIGMICDVSSLWFLSIPAAALACYIFNLPFLAVFVLAYLAEDIPKAIFCLVHFKSLKWLKPVTDEGIAGKNEYMLKNNKTNKVKLH